VALCDRCGEEIALAKPRSLTATHWQIFVLLYRHRGDVVSNDRIRRKLSARRDPPCTHLITEHMRQLRKVLTRSRYQIVNYRSIGYELIMADDAASVRPPEV
jgi:DNA-binding response OmpR family regulator